MTRLFSLLFTLILLVSPALANAQNSCTTIADCLTGQQCVNNTCVSGNTTNNGGDTTNDGGDTTNDSGGGLGLVNPLQSINSFPDLRAAILGAVVQIGFMLLILMLVFVGFKFVAAQGKEEELRNARSALVWTVIGGLILLGAEAISVVIQSTAKAL